MFLPNRLEMDAVPTDLFPRLSAVYKLPNAIFVPESELFEALSKEEISFADLLQGGGDGGQEYRTKAREFLASGNKSAQQDQARLYRWYLKAKAVNQKLDLVFDYIIY